MERFTALQFTQHYRGRKLLPYPSTSSNLLLLFIAYFCKSEYFIHNLVKEFPCHVADGTWLQSMSPSAYSRQQFCVKTVTQHGVAHGCSLSVEIYAIRKHWVPIWNTQVHSSDILVLKLTPVSVFILFSSQNFYSIQF